MNKLKLELARKNIAEKLLLGTAHINAMNGNTHYPVASRIPPDPQLQTVQDDLQSAVNDVEAAQVALRQKTELRDAREAAWDAAFTARASWCEVITPTDTSALASTGFSLRTQAASLGEPSSPEALTAEAGEDAGQIHLRCQPPTGARSYEWQCRPQAETNAWTSVKTTTAARMTMTGLTSGTVYAFRVRAIAAAGESPWSNEATKRAP